MLKVGLTGNIASGKSTVAKIWASLGAPIVDSDLLARQAVEPGSEALRRIVQRWGEGVKDESGALNRGKLRDRVFADPTELEALEAIVHPAIAELRTEALRQHDKAKTPVVVADVPLLYEVGLENEFDLVVFVHAPENVRRDRLIRDRGLESETADRMIRAQLPAEEKLRRADMVIVNDGTLDELELRATQAWHAIQRLAGKEVAKSDG